MQPTTQEMISVIMDEMLGKQKIHKFTDVDFVKYKLLDKDIPSYIEFRLGNMFGKILEKIEKKFSSSGDERHIYEKQILYPHHLMKRCEEKKLLMVMNQKGYAEVLDWHFTRDLLKDLSGQSDETILKLRELVLKVRAM